MALHVTQCPRCESTFNTSARVLQAAHGLVRCGACLSIFEADQHFVDLHSSASNDEGSHGGDASVFISAPEDYFNPGSFLKHGEGKQQDAGDWEDEEVLFAKSDVTDSDFDVFDVDPVDDDTLAKEQLTDSNFDVFNAGELDEPDAPAHLEVHNHEFDIFDAGEREIRRPIFMPAEDTGNDADNEQFDLRASFKFSAGTGPADFTAQILSGIVPHRQAALDNAPPPQARTRHGGDPRRERAATADQIPTLASRAGEVILPPGPDAATLLAARKKANEQSKSQPSSDAFETESDAEFLYDDDFDFEPTEGRFLDAGTDSSAGPGENLSLTELEFAEALSTDAEWEDADLEVDEEAFIILPVDPYQPSAFRSQTDTMPDNSEPRHTLSNQGGAPEHPAQRSFHPSKPADQAAHRPQRGARSSNPGNAADQDPLNAADDASGDEHSDERTGAAGRTPGKSAPEKPSPGSMKRGGQPAPGEHKDALRARIVATRLDDQDDALEQLSEENLRAVRDVDTSLELEHRNQRKRSSRIWLIALACMFIGLLLTGQFFWQRMPILSQDARFRPWYQSACDLLGCRLPAYVDPALIQTDNLVVRSHPQLPDTLELNAVFRNRAEFPQPFPLIELRFSDLNNSLVDSLEMTPDEYLPQALRGMPLMPAGAPVQISLELADPGPAAVNYQLRFRAAPPRPGS